MVASGVSSGKRLKTIRECTCRLLRRVNEYQDHILGIDTDIAQLWGLLRAPHPENALDKQIAATALIHELTVVTRNDKDFLGTGVPVFNPFKGKT